MPVMYTSWQVLQIQVISHQLQLVHQSRKRTEAAVGLSLMEQALMTLIMTRLFLIHGQVHLEAQQGLLQR